MPGIWVAFFLLPAVSWPWVPVWGSLEPCRRDGENAQKTRKNGEKMGELRSKKRGCSGGNHAYDHCWASGLHSSSKSVSDNLANRRRTAAWTRQVPTLPAGCRVHGPRATPRGGNSHETDLFDTMTFLSEWFSDKIESFIQGLLREVLGQVRFLTEILDGFRRFVDEIWRF